MVFIPYMDDSLNFALRVKRPYDWPSMLSFLGVRAIAGIEQIDDAVYRRSVQLRVDRRRYLGSVSIGPAKARAEFCISMSPSLGDVSAAVLERVGRLIDAAARPSVIAKALGPLAAADPGLRVPGAFDGFEIAVRAILGQQVTVAAARTVAGRFAAAFGTPIRNGSDGIRIAFPAPERIAGLTVDDIARLGVIASRARSIIALAGAVADRTIALVPNGDPAKEIEVLRSLPGIGQWTAQYIAMRAHKWPDAFPHTDYGVMKAMGEADPKRVLDRAEAWRPWRAYAVMHLWKSLSE